MPASVDKSPQKLILAPCGALTKAGGRCKTASRASGRCYFHDPTVTPEQRSAAGRAGADATNHAATVRAIGRAQSAATGRMETIAGALPPGEEAILRVRTPDDIEAALTLIANRVLAGSLPPSHAKVIGELLRVKIELASLAISERLAKLERHLKSTTTKRRKR